MATPIKPSIGTKTNYAARPSVPASQKESADEFNLLVNAVRANYERIILYWDTDIGTDQTLPVGQFVMFNGTLYSIISSYSVGNPITWDPLKAAAFNNLAPPNFRGVYDLSVETYPASGGTGAGGDPAIGNYWFGINSGFYDVEGFDDPIELYRGAQLVYIGGDVTDKASWIVKQ